MIRVKIRPLKRPYAFCAGESRHGTAAHEVKILDGKGDIIAIFWQCTECLQELPEIIKREIPEGGHRDG